MEELIAVVIQIVVEVVFEALWSLPVDLFIWGYEEDRPEKARHCSLFGVGCALACQEAREGRLARKAVLARILVHAWLFPPPLRLRPARVIENGARGGDRTPDQLGVNEPLYR